MTDTGGQPLTRDEESERASELRLAAIGATAFVAFYALHRLFQGTGPGSTDPAVVAEWITAQRPLLVTSEVALAAALLSTLVFLAPLVVVLREVGATITAAAVSLSGGVFVATGFVALAAESALFTVDVADPAVVVVLDGLQAHVPTVLAAAALATSLASAFWQRHLAWRWMGIASLAVAAVFTLGFIFEIVGTTSESSGSIVGVAVFTLWMALVAAALWVSSSRARSPDIR